MSYSNNNRTSNTTKKALMGLLVALTITGCESTDDYNGKVARSNQNTLISEFYATVENERPVTLDSNVDEGMVHGAAIGLIESADGDSEDMIAGTIFGALIGGIYTSIVEGGSEAYEYQINSVTHGQFTVVQKERLPQSANCIRVTSGQVVTLTPVNEQYCQSDKNSNVAKAQVSEPIPSNF